MDDPREEPIDTPEWRIPIERKLGLLRENILGSASPPRPRIADPSRESAVLVAVVAWFEAHGNIYRAMAHHRERELEVRFAHRDLRSWSIDYMVITEAPPRYAVDCMRAARALEIAVASTRIMPKENTRAA